MTLSLEANTHMEVQSLIEMIMPTDGRYNVDKYLNDDLPVCMELGNDSWEADFLKQLGREEQEVADDEEDEDELDAQPPPLKPQNFKEAVQSLEDVQQFLESRRSFKNRFSNGYHDYLETKSSKQTTLHDYCHS